MTWSRWDGPPEPWEDPDPDAWNDRRVDDLMEDADHARKYGAAEAVPELGSSEGSDRD